jgi:hypothetical protein
MRCLLLLLVPAALHAQMITANPCHLLTAEEVLSVTHDTLTRSLLSQFAAPECLIETSDSNTTIKVKVETTRDYEDAFWDVANSVQKPVPMLGERAVVMGDPPVTKVLRRGHVYSFTVTNVAMPPDAIREREKALASFAIARAP